MHDDPDYSVDSARAAAQQDRLADWVARFLASPGSDNPALAEQLCGELGWWAGPVQLPLDQLNRLAGPPGDPVLCPVDEDYWDDRVDALDKLAKEGQDPPPVIVAYRSDQFTLEDGNHRVEAVRRAGRRTTWAVVGFAQQEERDRFTVESSDSPTAGRQGSG
jgi:hypothetical protein